MKLVERWHELARELAPSLPGQWSLRGWGEQTVLVEEPWDWTARWIGFDRSAYSEDGWFMAAVEPLVLDRFRWALSFGIRMDEVRGGPLSVDLWADNAGQVLHDFVHGAALAVLDEWTVEKFAAAADKSMQRPVEKRRAPHYWLLAPGYRVVLDTGSPEEPLRQVIDHINESGKFATALLFYEELLERWQTGGRDKALKFLEFDRDRKMEEAGLHAH
ncbi:hypothetical protein BBK82_41730 [Lentzea guizhouensis]|uniref:DUF4304 domain-containing protein n=1 Tax=Lentzea guizhouensis TaxID=1586287 RepID=A0A1B2HUZ5_9PSEU|nr:hypothetical protein [Lentzea guizhouensis]ANZ41512.1 hypothetical protein BBK82_41730 [Lentzea guizhouensis]